MFSGQLLGYMPVRPTATPGAANAHAPRPAAESGDLQARPAQRRELAHSHGQLLGWMPARLTIGQAASGHRPPVGCGIGTLAQPSHHRELANTLRHALALGPGRHRHPITRVWRGLAAQCWKWAWLTD